MKFHAASAISAGAAGLLDRPAHDPRGSRSGPHITKKVPPSLLQVTPTRALAIVASRHQRNASLLLSLCHSVTLPLFLAACSTRQAKPRASCCPLDPCAPCHWTGAFRSAARHAMAWHFGTAAECGHRGHEGMQSQCEFELVLRLQSNTNVRSLQSKQMATGKVPLLKVGWLSWLGMCGLETLFCLCVPLDYNLKLSLPQTRT